MSKVIVLGRQVPTVWFPYMARLATVLSKESHALLRLARDSKPKTIIDLVMLSGMQVPNIFRILRKIKGYGLVALKMHAREICPAGLITEFLVVIF